MEIQQAPLSSPPSPTTKKGLSTGAKIGIGCGGLVVLAIIGFVIVGIILGGKLKNFAEEAQKNPTRAAASMMVTTGVGEMVAEDDINKRYTIKEKRSGSLTTFYWNARKNATDVIPGDFSAIPAIPAEPAPAAPDATAPDAATPDANGGKTPAAGQ